MNTQFINMAVQYGMSGIIFVGFLVTLKWVFDINSKILVDMSEERKLNQEIMRGFSDGIKSQAVTSRAFHAQVEEAHKYQREEHRQMIATLGRINGYKS